MEAAVAENVYAGARDDPARRVHVRRRAAQGRPAARSAPASGRRPRSARSALIPPTLEITHTGQEETLDGVLIRFQMTPGTECPVEMNFLFPERRALCMAENATHNLHNLVTLRGAVVRDARIWAYYLNEAIDLFADDMDVAFASHHWPTWGRDRVVTYSSQQRDLYAYLHDQTLRLMNQGYTGIEIAEMIEMPPALEAVVAHARLLRIGQPQREGHLSALPRLVRRQPGHLWQHPPVEAAHALRRRVRRRRRRHRQGARVHRRGRPALRRGAAQPRRVRRRHQHRGAGAACAGVYDKLGFGAENGTWRNFYLQGADELRNGVSASAIDLAGATDVVDALTIGQLFDSVAIRVNGPKAWDEHLTIDWVFTDLDHAYRTELTNGVLIHDVDPEDGTADLTLTLTKPQLLGLLGGARLDDIGTDGDMGAIRGSSRCSTRPPGLPDRHAIGTARPATREESCSKHPRGTTWVPLHGITTSPRSHQ